MVQRVRVFGYTSQKSHAVRSFCFILIEQTILKVYLILTYNFIIFLQRICIHKRQNEK